MSLSGSSIIFFLGVKLGEAAVKKPDDVSNILNSLQKGAEIEQVEKPSLPPLIVENNNKEDLPLPPLMVDADELPPLLVPDEADNDATELPVFDEDVQPENIANLPPLPGEEVELEEELAPLPPLEEIMEEAEDSREQESLGNEEKIVSNTKDDGSQADGFEMMLPALPGLDDPEEEQVVAELPAPEESLPEEQYIPEPVSEEEILMRMEIAKKEKERREQKGKKVQLPSVEEESEELDTDLGTEIELIDDGGSLFSGLTEDMAEDPTKKLMEEVAKKEKEVEEEEKRQREKEEEERKEKEAEKEQKIQERYDPHKVRKIPDYKNQKLPAPVHAKQYNKENQHLPRAVYNEDHYKMFFLAAQNGDLKALHALKPLISEINRKDRYGNTVLIKAVLSGQIQSVRFLLANNANPDVQNKDGVASMHIAASMDRPDIIEALKAKGADLYVKDKYGREPYIYAMEKGYWGVMGQLVDGQYNPDEKLPNGDYKLINAIKIGKPKYVAFLLEKGANPNVRDNQNYTPLMLAAYNGQGVIVEALLKYSADPYARDGYNRDAIILAEMAGFYRIAQRVATERIRDTLR